MPSCFTSKLSVRGPFRLEESAVEVVCLFVFGREGGSGCQRLFGMQTVHRTFPSPPGLSTSDLLSLEVDKHGLSISSAPFSSYINYSVSSMAFPLSLLL